MNIDTSVNSSDLIGLFGYTEAPSTTEEVSIGNFYLVNPRIIDKSSTYASLFWQFIIEEYVYMILK